MNDSAANLTENVKRAALLQKLGYKSCLVTNHWYLVTTQPPINFPKGSYTIWDYFHGEIYFFGPVFSTYMFVIIEFEVWSKFWLFHWKRNNLLWTNFIINWSHVRILLAICESKFPPPWLTSPPALRALRLPQWDALCALPMLALKWSMPFNSEIPKLLRTDLKTYRDRCKVHPCV